MAKGFHLLCPVWTRDLGSESINFSCLTVAAGLRERLAPYQRVLVRLVWCVRQGECSLCHLALSPPAVLQVLDHTYFRTFWSQQESLGDVRLLVLQPYYRWMATYMSGQGNRGCLRRSRVNYWRIMGVNCPGCDIRKTKN